MSVIFTSSVCLPSWVMARRRSVSICMLPWVMARLCAWDWVSVRSGSPSWAMDLLVYFSSAMDWLGYFSSAMDWLGYLSSAMDSLGSLSWAWMHEDLSLRAWTGAGPSLSRPGLGRTISLGGGTISPLDKTISPCVRSALFGPGVSLHALSLRAGSRSLHVTRGIFLPKHSCPISLQVACIQLVPCHTNTQLGNIGFTCPCVDGF